MAKKQFWNPKEILSCNAQYNIVYGARSNGKSYAIKHMVCKNACKDPEHNKFIYLRRRDLEGKQSSVMSYFNDLKIKECFGKDASRMMIKSNRIYCVYEQEDPETGKVKRLKDLHVGYVCTLSTYAHTAGENYNDVSDVVYEEFISRETYIRDEPSVLIDFVSTVARLRNIRVWLLGNTITRYCPYFTEWELTGVMRQPIDSIDVYHIDSGRTDEDGNKIMVDIACERCREVQNDSKMFFGQRSKMITKGEWQTDAKPHLERRLESYNILYEMVVESMKFRFWCRFLYDPETQGCFWYIEPKTTEVKPMTRVVSDRFNPSPYYTIGLVALCPEEAAIFKEFLYENIVYSDNLCGTEFQQAIKNLRSR